MFAASAAPVTKNLPSSVAAYTFFIRYDFLDRIFRCPWLASVSSPLVSDVSNLWGLCEGPCFSRSSTSFSSTKQKNGHCDSKNNTTKLKRRKVLIIHQRRQPLSLLLFADGATQGHQLMTSGKDHSGSGIGPTLIYNTNKNGKNLEPTWNNTSKFLI